VAVCAKYCSILPGSETWPARKENEVAIQWAEIRMVRWMCDVMVKDRIPSTTAKQVAMIWACVAKKE